MKFASREYTGKDVNVDKLAEAIKTFFSEEGFKIQDGVHPKGHLIQVRKGGIFRTLLAMDRAFTIIVEGDSSDVKVKIGVGKWLQDLGVAALEAFFFAPVVAFIEVPESLWSYEIEHQFWHHIENQIELGLQ
ncbi:MAG: hypothetical protein M1533_02930 [Candidatus Thermoplasmatota archaeon]|jgi:hypothetical protein|nr:hypothetical protein [Candidatus Thermoplasmatota archaeon]MCL5793631.1 hypothetical protein [Candidatus Thermoplasmatota archaeon]